MNDNPVRKVSLRWADWEGNSSHRESSTGSPSGRLPSDWEESYPRLKEEDMEDEERLSEENPFRPEGELAREADEILGALKSGKLENVSREGPSPKPPEIPTSNGVKTLAPPEAPLLQNSPPESPLNSFSEVDVQRTFIPDPKTKMAEVEKVNIGRKKEGCCLLL